MCGWITGSKKPEKAFRNSKPCSGSIRQREIRIEKAGSIRSKEGKEMDIQKILSYCDHTLLAPEATWEGIRALCDDGIRYKTATVCIPPCYVKQAKDYVKDQLRVCTVIGFPHGNSTTEAKVFECEDAVKNGADEIDMVINIGWVKDGLYDQLTDEIRRIKEATGGKLLKVIFEICLLTEEEIVKVCECCMEAGADFVKTSTGFSTGGATFDAVALMKKTVGDRCEIKAAGGIASLEDAERFMELGATRLGTSRVVKIVKSME